MVAKKASFAFLNQKLSDLLKTVTHKTENKQLIFKKKLEIFKVPGDSLFERVKSSHFQRITRSKK